jgi:2-oxoacid:acceptor oxidoreductase gamma subunit (pyruvate/2-ketoisovalerate family)
MREIRIHGRGGQGAVTAGIILAQALFNAGYYVQTFPIFGVERRGAPVAAYVRVGNSEILQRYNIYSPNDVIVLDEALLDVVDVYEGWKQFGDNIIFINSDPRETTKSEHFINVKKIAWRYNLGSKQAPIVNTAMVGAYLGYWGIKLEHGLAAVEQHVPIKTKENAEAFQEAYEKIRHRARTLETRRIV